MKKLASTTVSRLRGLIRRLQAKGYTSANAIQKALFDNGHLNDDEAILKALGACPVKNPRRGRMPKALAKYWRTHKRNPKAAKKRRVPASTMYARLRRKRKHQKAINRSVNKSLQKLTKAQWNQIYARQHNPSGTQRFVVKARKGATGVVMAWNGEKFSDHMESAARFYSLHHAVAVGQLLREKFPVLKKYQLWADRVGSSATP